MIHNQQRKREFMSIDPNPTNNTNNDPLKIKEKFNELIKDWKELRLIDKIEKVIELILKILGLVFGFFIIFFDIDILRDIQSIVVYGLGVIVSYFLIKDILPAFTKKDKLINILKCIQKLIFAYIIMTFILSPNIIYNFQTATTTKVPTNEPTQIAQADPIITEKLPENSQQIEQTDEHLSTELAGHTEEPETNSESLSFSNNEPKEEPALHEDLEEPLMGNEELEQESAEDDELEALGVDKSDPNYKIKIGVFDIGDTDKTKETISFLETFNFQVELVKINAEETYENYQILYMPNGWYSEIGLIENNLKNIRKFMNRKDVGLFIGNPNPPLKKYTFELFVNFNLEYWEITDDEILKAEPFEISKNEESDLFESLMKDVEVNSIPFPERKIVLSEKPGLEPYDYVVLSRGLGIGKLYPLISSYENSNGRYVLMAGNELSTIKDDNFYYFYPRMIKWLAHIPLN
jgi:hypothetical protein